MRNSILVCRCALAFLGVSVAVRAQEPAAAAPSTRLTAVERRAATGATLGTRPDPTRRSVVSGPSPTFILEASAKAKTAAGRIGIQLGDVLLDLKLQGVIDTDTRQAVIADLSGLRNKSTAEFGLTWTHWTERPHSAALALACAEGGAQRACPPDAGAAFAQRVRANLPKTLWLAGASWAIGPEQFRYVPAAGADSARETRTNWAVSARAGLVTRGWLAAGGQYLHDVSYTAGDSHEICEPVGESGLLECSERVVGKPTRSAREVVTFEVRAFAGPRLGLNPRVAVRLASKAVAVEVPVYFLQHPDGGLSGGVTLGWRHSPRDGDAFLVTAFIGQVFTLIVK